MTSALTEPAANGSETTALVPRQPTPSWNAIHNLAEALQIAKLAAESCLFPGVTTQAAAMMKILCGAEMGFGPFASLADVHVIEGKASIGAHLRAAAIKSSGRYDYRVLELTRDRCELEFYERGRPVGRVAVTLKEFLDSGAAIDKNGRVKTNWHRTPDDMMFARAISKGYRRYCPDLSGGVLAYSPEELDSEERAALPAPPVSTAPIIDVTPEPAQPPAPIVSPTPPPLTLEQLAVEHRRTPPEIDSMCIALGVPDLAHVPADKEARARQMIIQGQATPRHADELNAVCDRLGYSAEKRLGWLRTRYGVDSFGRLTVPEAEQLLAKLQAVPKPS